MGTLSVGWQGVCVPGDARALQGDLTQRVSGDREAGPEPADCPPRPSAAAGIKKRLPWCRVGG